MVGLAAPTYPPYGGTGEEEEEEPPAEEGNLGGPGPDPALPEEEKD